MILFENNMERPQNIRENEVKVMETKTTATIHRLTICHTCHKKVKKNESHVEWENSIYCEPCFDIYLELIEPKDWEKDQ